MAFRYFILFICEQVYAFPNPPHYWYGHAVPTRFVAGAIGAFLGWLPSVGNLGVVIRESLKAFALDWGEPSDGHVV